MAAEGEAKVEIKVHERDYSKFVALLKWGAIISFVAAMLVIFIIA